MWIIIAIIILIIVVTNKPVTADSALKKVQDAIDAGTINSNHEIFKIGQEVSKSVATIPTDKLETVFDIPKVYTTTIADNVITQADKDRIQTLSSNEVTKAQIPIEYPEDVLKVTSNVVQNTSLAADMLLNKPVWTLADVGKKFVYRLNGKVFTLAFNQWSGYYSEETFISYAKRDCDPLPSID
jgi:hypothetical protein